jgi:hypothetical protein
LLNVIYHQLCTLCWLCYDCILIIHIFFNLILTTFILVWSKLQTNIIYLVIKHQIFNFFPLHLIDFLPYFNYLYNVLQLPYNWQSTHTMLIHMIHVHEVIKHHVAINDLKFLFLIIGFYDNNHGNGMPWWIIYVPNTMFCDLNVHVWL